jgi:hypothetical protein
MSDKNEPRDLTPARVADDDSRRVDLRDLGFVGFVSNEALAEIDRNETRASRAVTTAATFAFR